MCLYLSFLLVLPPSSGDQEHWQCWEPSEHCSIKIDTETKLNQLTIDVNWKFLIKSHKFVASVKTTKWHHAIRLTDFYWRGEKGRYGGRGVDGVCVCVCALDQCPRFSRDFEKKGEVEPGVSPSPAGSKHRPAPMTGLPSVKKSPLIVGRNSSGLAERLSGWRTGWYFTPW